MTTNQFWIRESASDLVDSASKKEETRHAPEIARRTKPTARDFWEQLE
jgi:hypothetical protein